MTQPSFSRLATLAMALAAMNAAGCASATEAALSQPAPASAEAAVPSLCEDGETTVFSGDVEDDFGLGLSVCVVQGSSEGQTRITVRTSGEGGGSTTSCMADACDGVIGLQHYRRPRMTILKLEWMDNGSFNRLTETFDAEVPEAPPIDEVTYHWASARMLAEGTAPLADPVTTRTEALSLLKLASYLPARDWPEPALGDKTPAIVEQTADGS